MMKKHRSKSFNKLLIDLSNNTHTDHTDDDDDDERIKKKKEFLTYEKIKRRRIDIDENKQRRNSSPYKVKVKMKMKNSSVNEEKNHHRSMSEYDVNMCNIKGRREHHMIDENENENEEDGFEFEKRLKEERKFENCKIKLRNLKNEFKRKDIDMGLGLRMKGGKIESEINKLDLSIVFEGKQMVTFKSEEMEKKFLEDFYGEKAFYIRFVLVVCALIFGCYYIFRCIEFVIMINNGIKEMLVVAYYPLLSILLFLRIIPLIIITMGAIIVQFKGVYLDKKRLESWIWRVFILFHISNGVAQCFSPYITGQIELTENIIMICTIGSIQMRTIIHVTNVVWTFLTFLPIFFVLFVVRNGTLHFQDIILNLVSYLIICIPALMYAFKIETFNRQSFVEDVKERNLEKLKKIEKQRKTQILHNIIPQQLLYTVNKRYFNYNSKLGVLINDVVGFTVFSFSISSDVLVDFLDKLYSDFDKIILESNLERVKTIGDSFFCFDLECTNNENSTLKIILAAHQMVKSFQKLMSLLNIDLGLRTGCSYADGYISVFGNNYFTFDLFGRVITEAKEMEASCDVGRIQVTDEFKNSFESLQLNEIDVKFEKSEKGHHIRECFEKKITKTTEIIQKNNLNFADIETPRKSLLENEESIEFNNELEISKVLLLFKSKSTYFSFIKHDFKKYYLRFQFFNPIVLIITYSLYFFDLLLVGKKVWSSYYMVVFCVIYMGYVIYCIITLFCMKYFLPSFINSWINLIFALIISMIYILTFFGSAEYIDFDRLTYAILLVNFVCTIQNSNYLSKIVFLCITECFFTSFHFGLVFKMEEITVSSLIFTMFVCLACLVCSFPGIYAFDYLKLYAHKKRKKFSKTMELMEKELKKTNKILKSVLPQPVIEELILNKKKNSTHLIKNGSIAFIKIKGCIFKENSEDLLNWLSDVFDTFDNVVDELKCNKIKSFGTSYLVVNGLDRKKSKIENKKLMLKCCIEIIKRTEKKFKNKIKEGISLHAGIHSGVFCAGIVGTSKYLYDVFGANVNFSYRLSDNSGEFQIHVSRDFTEDLDSSLFAERYKIIRMKGIEKQKTFFVK